MPATMTDYHRKKAGKPGAMIPQLPRIGDGGPQPFMRPPEPSGPASDGTGYQTMFGLPAGLDRPPLPAVSESAMAGLQLPYQPPASSGMWQNRFFIPGYNPNAPVMTADQRVSAGQGRSPWPQLPPSGVSPAAGHPMSRLIALSQYQQQQQQQMQNRMAQPGGMIPRQENGMPMLPVRPDSVSLASGQNFIPGMNGRQYLDASTMPAGQQVSLQYSPQIEAERARMGRGPQQLISYGDGTSKLLPPPRYEAPQPTAEMKQRQAERKLAREEKLRQRHQFQQQRKYGFIPQLPKGKGEMSMIGATGGVGTGSMVPKLPPVGQSTVLDPSQPLPGFSVEDSQVFRAVEGLKGKPRAAALQELEAGGMPLFRLREYARGIQYLPERIEQQGVTGKMKEEMLARADEQQKILRDLLGQKEYDTLLSEVGESKRGFRQRQEERERLQLFSPSPASMKL